MDKMDTSNMENMMNNNLGMNVSFPNVKVNHDKHLQKRLYAQRDSEHHQHLDYE